MAHCRQRVFSIVALFVYCFNQVLSLHSIELRRYNSSSYEALGGEYVGCFLDTAIQFSGARMESAHMSIDHCVEFCSLNWTPFAVGYYQDACRCATDIRRRNLSQVSEDRCNRQCVGKTSQFCGGRNTSSIYRIERTVPATEYNLIACVSNATYQHQTPKQLGFTMTVQQCSSYCYMNSFTLFGVQGQSCFCMKHHPSVDDVSHYPDESCHPCSPSKGSDSCGGPKAVSVYFVSRKISCVNGRICKDESCALTLDACCSKDGWKKCLNGTCASRKCQETSQMENSVDVAPNVAWKNGIQTSFILIASLILLAFIILGTVHWGRANGANRSWPRSWRESWRNNRRIRSIMGHRNASSRRSTHRPLFSASPPSYEEAMRNLSPKETDELPPYESLLSQASSASPPAPSS